MKKFLTFGNILFMVLDVFLPISDIISDFVVLELYWRNSNFEWVRNVYHLCIYRNKTYNKNIKILEIFHKTPIPLNELILNDIK